jgi:hypothetical protein
LAAFGRQHRRGRRRLASRCNSTQQPAYRHLAHPFRRHVVAAVALEDSPELRRAHLLDEADDRARINSVESRLVQDLVLPNIRLFGPLVYGVEVTIGVSLMLGLLTRLGAVFGLLMALNLWLGLYSAPGEWPWTYAFLVILQLLFAIDPRAAVSEPMFFCAAAIASPPCSPNRKKDRNPGRLPMQR